MPNRENQAECARESRTANTTGTGLGMGLATPRAERAVYKLISVDGLVGYQFVMDHHHPDSLYRTVALPMRVGDLNEAGDPLATCQTYRRVYRLHDRHFDEERGIMMYVYRERLEGR